MFDKLKEKLGEKKDQFSEKIQEIKEKQTPPGEIKKRHRRTKAELEGAKVEIELRDNGFELISDFIKTLSDRDVKVYHLEPVDKAQFIPIAKSYAKIINHFVPKGKPIYLLIGMTLFQTFSMLKHRAELINVKNPPKPKEQKPPEKKPDKKPDKDNFPKVNGLKKQKV